MKEGVQVTEPYQAEPFELEGIQGDVLRVMMIKKPDLLLLTKLVFNV